MPKLVLDIPLNRATQEYVCDKPKKWDSMDTEAKYFYFQEHMQPRGTPCIDTDVDDDWYDSIDFDEDFVEEK